MKDCLSKGSQRVAVFPPESLLQTLFDSLARNQSMRFGEMPCQHPIMPAVCKLWKQPAGSQTEGATSSIESPSAGRHGAESAGMKQSSFLLHPVQNVVHHPRPTPSPIRIPHSSSRHSLLRPLPHQGHHHQHSHPVDGMSMAQLAFPGSSQARWLSLNLERRSPACSCSCDL